MRAHWSMAAVLVAIAVALTGTLTAQTNAQPPVGELIARLDRYLIGYEPRLSELIADEAMVQNVNSTASFSVSRESLTPGITRRRRRLASEVAFVALPNDAGWLGFRNVKTVNGRKVEQREHSLASALQTSSYDAGRALLKASAEQNLGLPRTTNLPNLPLEFLHQRNRERLAPRFDGNERIRGVMTTRVVFIERASPTLIQDPNGGDMPSVVRAWIDPNGRLIRAEVSTFRHPSAHEAENNIRVDFTTHKSLGMLVPTAMHETFPVEQPAQGTGVANYSNFRRFQTSARIVTPPGQQ